MHKEESYFYLLWKSLWTTFTFVALFLGVILPIVFWHWKSETKISLFWVIIIGYLLFFLLAIFVRFSMILYEKTQNLYEENKNLNENKKATVLRIIDSYGNFKSDSSAIALTTYTDYFTENGIVSIFYLDNGFEKPIALGRIINIQADKKVQILMSNIDSEYYEKLLRNNAETLEKTCVKPIVKITALEDIRYDEQRN